MSEHEIQGLVIVYGIVAIVTAFAFWVGTRGEEGFRKMQRELNEPFTIIMADGWGVSRKEALKRIKETEKRLGIKRK